MLMNIAASIFPTEHSIFFRLVSGVFVIKMRSRQNPAKFSERMDKRFCTYGFPTYAAGYVHQERIKCRQQIKSKSEIDFLPHPNGWPRLDLLQCEMMILSKIR